MIEIKIVFLYDRQVNDFHNRVLDIENYMKNTFKNKMNISFELEKSGGFDLYIILSDDIETIEKYQKKINNKKKLIIITQNKNIDYIIKCINITKNMYYLYSSNEYLVNRFKKVYESNLAKYN